MCQALPASICICADFLCAGVLGPAPAWRPREAPPRGPFRSFTAADQLALKGPLQAARAGQHSQNVGPEHIAPPAAHVLPAPAAVTFKKLTTAKNLQMLLQLHCTYGHRHFSDVAKRFGLTLPITLPKCWSCLLSKPTLISHDKLSTRSSTRPYENMAADAKGPINTPTPEGYKYYFLLICLYSYHIWVILAKSPKDWETIWPKFVARVEAESGRAPCVASITTDGHKVHTKGTFREFNDKKGIRTVRCAPHSQWQDPAERQIQTVQNMSRTSLIHGGGEAWMWGWAVKHSGAAVVRLYPPVAVPSMEGRSRLRILRPTMTEEQEARTQHPFLCLCFKTVPHKERGSNFDWRANPCLHLVYDTDKKSYMLFTLPELHLTDSVEVRHMDMTFPLRMRNYRTRQLDAFLRPAEEQGVFDLLHGPRNILRRHAPAPQDDAAGMLVQPTPVLAAAPREPGGTRTRLYTPSVQGLESAASINLTQALGFDEDEYPELASSSDDEDSEDDDDLEPAASVNVTQASGFKDDYAETGGSGSSSSSSSSGVHVQRYTPDQLAKRTPRGPRQALQGVDKKFWIPAVRKDFNTLRTRGCFINPTYERPHGPAPPGIEQRYKIKRRSKEPIALADLDPKAWKARTVARGDRFRIGEHYDATASPVIHAAATKMFLAWAVAKGLHLFEWDEEAAFYGNNMDKPLVVKLPPGFHPTSEDILPLDSPPMYATMVKGVPGIPQGSLLQYNDITPALLDLGFAPSQADNCLFVHTSLSMAATLHVDDGILACPSLEHAEAILGSQGLGKTRNLTWGPLKSTLGIDFKTVYTPERRTVFMGQPAYAATIMERAGMQDCNAARTPAIPGYKYTKADCPATDEAKAEVLDAGYNPRKYRTINASINFLVTMTRPDLRFVNGKVNKYNANPGIPHFKAQKHELRFLQGTRDYGVEFNWYADHPEPVDGPLHIMAYSDSSFADDVDTGRTTLGFVIQVNGATVSAGSWLSPRVDSCVNHSELNAFGGMVDGDDDEVTDSSSMAMIKMGRTVTWLRGIKAALEGRDLAAMPPTPCLVDNNGVLSMLKDITIKTANRHIFRSLAENRERVNLDKIVVPGKVDTKDNLANAMTKQERAVAESAAQLRQIAGPCTL